MAPFSITIINWTSYNLEEEFLDGEKDREFVRYFSLPQKVCEPMEIAANAPSVILQRLAAGGWRLVDRSEVTKNLARTKYKYLARSRAEFCVAKHGYVKTQCGWFSDRSTAYLALSRPVVIQDTGFSAFLPFCAVTPRTRRRKRRLRPENPLAEIMIATVVLPAQ